MESLTSLGLPALRQAIGRTLAHMQRSDDDSLANEPVSEPDDEMAQVLAAFRVIWAIPLLISLRLY